MYVCTRVGQRLALAPRPLMIYCAMCYFTQSSLLKPFATWMMRVTFLGLLQSALYMVPLRFHGMRCPYTCMMGEMMQNGMARSV
jgi:hypothetical protein